jgi:hypothetical protein
MGWEHFSRTPYNFSEVRCSKALRLATLDFGENFSSAPLELFLLWLLPDTKTHDRGG